LQAYTLEELPLMTSGYRPLEGSHSAPAHTETEEVPKIGFRLKGQSPHRT